MTLTIGISGVGSIGAQHAIAFADAGARVLAWDPASGREQTRERTRGRAEVVGDLDELIESSDGIVVAAPDEHHAAQVVQIADAGLAALVEKPVTATVAEAERLREIVGDAPVLVGYVLRHYRSMRRLHGLLEEGAIGEIVSFHATVGAYDTIRLARARFDHPKPDRLYLDYSHEWDYLNWLVGGFDRCIALAATRGRLDVREEPNVVDALLAGGEVGGSVHLDYVQDPSVRSCTIVGDRGSVTATPAAGELRWARGDEEQVEHFDAEREDGLRRQADHFLDVVRGLVVPLVTIDDGLAALRVADAVRRSALSGGWTSIEEGKQA